jgi:hypothetical protein
LFSVISIVFSAIALADVISDFVSALPVQKLNLPDTDTELGCGIFIGVKMTQGSYKQFCPVAMTAEILCTRWTIVLLREMFAGSTRFNDLRRGVPRMSPALLSQRLKELEAAGIVSREAGAQE